jgi:hypothetical protein
VRPRALADPTAKKLLNFGVVAQKKDEEIFWSILKDEPQGQVAPTLEKAVAELANADSPMAIRLTEGLCQLNECQQAFDALPFLKLPQAF